MNFLINIILDLLFPRRCPVCGQIVMPKGSLICPGCVKKLSWVRGPVCKCCGKEIISGTMEYCPDCAAHPRSFSHGMALFNYNEISAPSLAMVKYHDRREYLDFYGKSRRAVKQHMIENITSLFCCFNIYFQVLFRLFLSDVVVQVLGTERTFDFHVLLENVSCDNSSFHRYKVSFFHNLGPSAKTYASMPLSAQPRCPCLR